MCGTHNMAILFCPSWLFATVTDIGYSEFIFKFDDYLVRRDELEVLSELSDVYRGFASRTAAFPHIRHCRWSAGLMPTDRSKFAISSSRGTSDG
jgi:hypothetical protein